MPSPADGLLGLWELGAHRLRGGTALRPPTTEGLVHVEEVGKVFTEPRVDRPMVLRVQATVRTRHKTGDDLVGLPERYPPRHEVLGEVRREESWIGRGREEAPFIELEGRDPCAERVESRQDVVDRIEHGSLVLLEIALVSERERLEGRQEGDEVSEAAARRAAGTPGDVGGGLLGHEAASVARRRR